MLGYHFFLLGEGTGGLSISSEGGGVRVAWLGSGVRVNASLEVTKLSDMLTSLPGILKTFEMEIKIEIIQLTACLT